MLLVVSLGALGGGQTVAARQNPGEIRLVPYVSEQMNCSGLRPEGWVETSMGTYASVLQGGTLIQQAGPLAKREPLIDTWIKELGIDAFPEPFGSYVGEYLTFDLYRVSYAVSGSSPVPVDFALAETRDQFFTAAIFAEPPVYAFLHDAVFLPVLDAYRPGTDPVEVPLDPDEIRMIPFDTNAGLGYAFPWTGVRPAGWRMVVPGVYRRDLEGTTAAQLTYALLPNVTLDYLTTMVPLGLQETYQLPQPPSSTRVAAGARSWTVFRAAVTDHGHDVVMVIAVAADDAGFGYQVGLVSAPDEIDGLYNAVLLPGLDAFEYKPRPAEPPAVTS
jgi:hypothetical protein